MIIEIGFFDTGSTTGINYYPAVDSYNEPSRLSLVDQSNSSSGIQFSSTLSGTVLTGSSVAAGISLPSFSDEVEGSYFYASGGGWQEYTFWGMPAGTHTITVFGSRGAPDTNRIGEYKFGSDTGTLNASQNTSNVLELTYTASEGEDVVFGFRNNTGSTYGYLNCALLDVSTGPAVTQSDTTPEDGVQQSFTTTGLTGTITAATLGGYDILSLLSDTDPTTATTYTLDISAIEASQGAPRIGQTSTLSITATGGTATTDVVIQPKTGWAEVDLAGTLNKDAGGFLALLDSTLGLTSAVGDIIYYDASSNAAITAAGVYTSDLTTAGQNTPFVIQQGGSATTVSTSEGGAFYPYGESGGGSNVPKTKYRRFPWQPWNPL